jgi:hypothetical protein
MKNKYCLYKLNSQKLFWVQVISRYPVINRLGFFDYTLQSSHIQNLEMVLLL